MFFFKIWGETGKKKKVTFAIDVKKFLHGKKKQEKQRRGKETRPDIPASSVTVTAAAPMVYDHRVIPPVEVTCLVG